MTTLNSARVSKYPDVGPPGQRSPGLFMGCSLDLLPGASLTNLEGTHVEAIVSSRGEMPKKGLPTQVEAKEQRENPEKVGEYIKRWDARQRRPFH